MAAANFGSFNGYPTKCKELHAKNQQNFSTLSRDISDLLFQRILVMPDHTQLRGHDNTEASLDV